MKFALGCGFSVNEILENLPYKKLKISCKECYEAIGDNHRQVLASRVFRKSFNLIIEDIIERNVTFWLPVNGTRQCNMHMNRVTGEEFKKLRRAGKWQDVDFIKSNFSGYRIGFYMLGNRTPRVKTVYVGRQLRDLITKYTNEGKQYGDSCIDTKLQDYLPKIYELFPKVPQSDIKKILSFSWKSLYLHNSYGGDVLISDSIQKCYIGNLNKGNLKHFSYYIRKLITKLRVLYKRRQIPWDGYYYFALSDEQYNSYISQIKSTGRPRKTFNFGSVYLYQILDECRLTERSKRYIFRTPMITTIKIKYCNSNLNAYAELIEERPPLKFKDILVKDNKYEFL